MANRLHAGSKIHLQSYSVKNINGKIKFRKVKMMIGGHKYDSNLTMCGTTHSSQDIDFFAHSKKNYPDLVCKNCAKKIKEIINNAQGCA
jgi:hypothetical protein